MGWFRYKIKIVCDNCGCTSLINIPNGTTIKNFLSDERGRCRYCKCSSFSNYHKPNLDLTNVKKM